MTSQRRSDVTPGPVTSHASAPLPAFQQHWMTGYRLCMVDVLRFLSRDLGLSHGDVIYARLKAHLQTMEKRSKEEEETYWSRHASFDSSAADVTCNRFHGASRPNHTLGKPINAAVTSLRVTMSAFLCQILWSNFLFHYLCKSLILKQYDTTAYTTEIIVSLYIAFNNPLSAFYC